MRVTKATSSFVGVAWCLGYPLFVYPTYHQLCSQSHQFTKIITYTFFPMNSATKQRIKCMTLVPRQHFIHFLWLLHHSTTEEPRDASIETLGTTKSLISKRSFVRAEKSLRLFLCYVGEWKTWNYKETHIRIKRRIFYIQLLKEKNNNNTDPSNLYLW